MHPARRVVKEWPANPMEGKGPAWALAALLRASRPVGLAPVTFGQRDRPCPSLAWRLYSVAFFLGFAVLVCWHTKLCADMFVAGIVHPLAIGGFIVVIMQHISAILILASSCWDGGIWLRDLTDQLVRVDSILGVKEYNYYCIHKTIRRTSMILFISFLLILSICYLSNVTWVLHYQFFPFFLGTFLSKVFIIQYSAVTTLLNHRIVELNNHLLENSKKFEQVPEHSRLAPMFSTKQLYQFVTRDMVDRIAEAYSMLYDVSCLIGMRLGIPLLAQLLTILVGLVCWSFMLLFLHQTFPKGNYTIVNIVMPLYNFLLLMWISVRSHYVSENASRTSQLVHRLLVRLQQMQFLHPESIESTDALRQLSLQLLHERLQLNAAGLLPLDKTLLLGAAAFVFTNILILLQFVIKEPEKSLDSFRQATIL